MLNIFLFPPCLKMFIFLKDAMQLIECVVFTGGYPHQSKTSQHKPSDSSFKKEEISYHTFGKPLMHKWI
jgi:hypothetical protein